LEELEWQRELDDFLLNNAKEIEESKDLDLNMKLQRAKGNEAQYVKLKRELLSSIKTVGPNVVTIKTA
jgi:hypothetical protein